MINIIINNQIFIPKESILYIDTECVVSESEKSGQVKQCRVYLRDAVAVDIHQERIENAFIPIPYEHIAILKQAVRDALTGISTNNCLKLNTEQEPVYKSSAFSEINTELEWRKYLQEKAQTYLNNSESFTSLRFSEIMANFVLGLDKRFLALLSFPDSLPNKECGDVINEVSIKERELLDFVYVDCPKCDCSNEVFTKDKNFPLIQCASCLKEFTYYQTKESIERITEKLKIVIHCGERQGINTLCGKSIDGLDDTFEDWGNRYSFVLPLSKYKVKCSQCNLILTQLS